MTSIFNMINDYTQVFQWLANSFYNVIKNISTYSDQIFQVVNLLPTEIKGVIVATLSISVVYMLLRMVL